MDFESNTEIAPHPVAYFATLKRHWLILAIIPSLIALGAFGLTSLLGTTYRASATLLVNPAVGPSDNAANDVTAAITLAKTYSTLVLSPPILKQVIADLHLNETPTQLASRVSVKTDPSSETIEVSTKYGDAQTAADITNAIGDNFVTFLTDTQKAGVDQGSQALQQSIEKARTDRDTVSSQLAALRAAPGTLTPEQNAQIANLSSLLEQDQNTYSGLLDLQQRTKLAQFAAQNHVNLIVRAEPPPRPTNIRQWLYTAAAFFGAFAAIAAVFILREQTKPRVRSLEDLRRVADLPILGIVPQFRTRAGVDLVDDPRSPSSRAIQSLSTRVHLTTNCHEAVAITVISPDCAEDTALVAANIGLALAQVGERVVIVDGNLRTPSLWKLFKKDAKQPGLVELLSVSSLSLCDVLVCTPHERLQLLPAGSVSNDPAERLTRRPFERILADLRKRADVIVIAAPPLQSSADALLFAATTDDTVVITVEGKTPMSAIQTALTSIREVGGSVPGLVFCSQRRSSPVA